MGNPRPSRSRARSVVPTSASMASEVVLTTDDASLVEAARSRRFRALADRDLRASVLVGGAFFVVAAAGGKPLAWRRWPVSAGRAGARFGRDSSRAAIRQRLALGVGPRVPLGFMAMVYFVDAALSPVGVLLAALARVWARLLTGA